MAKKYKNCALHLLHHGTCSLAIKQTNDFESSLYAIRNIWMHDGTFRAISERHAGARRQPSRSSRHLPSCFHIPSGATLCGWASREERLCACTNRSRPSHRRYCPLKQAKLGVRDGRGDAKDGQPKWPSHGSSSSSSSSPLLEAIQSLANSRGW